MSTMTMMIIIPDLTTKVTKLSAVPRLSPPSLLLLFLFCCFSLGIRRYILAEASGANLNPAVSIALLVGKRISVERFVLYFIAQVN